LINLLDGGLDALQPAATKGETFKLPNNPIPCRTNKPKTIFAGLETPKCGIFNSLISMRTSTIGNGISFGI